ncbi:CD225/dispanin family protein [Streptomyces sp. NPDC048281]|uniref:CD225/dispanin family protein n=1 Tax=Streptomyces sp. NPDC048281 TaxID=3154715 RepID=UPI00342D219A
MRRRTFSELEGQDPYDVLGVSRDATAEQIGRSRREALRTCHPDLRHGDVQRAALINAAHDILTHPADRAEYDRWARERQAAPEPGPGTGDRAVWEEETVEDVAFRPGAGPAPDAGPAPGPGPVGWNGGAWQNLPHGPGAERWMPFAAPAGPQHVWHDFTQGRPARPPSAFVAASVVALLACLPFGVAALMASSQVRTRWAMGDAAGARAASRRTLRRCAYAYAVGLVYTVALLAARRSGTP